MPKKKVMLVCEPPTITTGFAVVSNVLTRALAKEFDVFLFATGGKGQDCITPDLFSDIGVKIATATGPHNTHGTDFFDIKVREFEPDLIYVYYDTGSVGEYVVRTHFAKWPTASYLMVEGSPLMVMWKRMLADTKKEPFDFTLNDVLLPSKTAAADVFEQTGRQCEVAYHAADHANFRQLPNEYRKKLREELARDTGDPSVLDAFIYCYNARNVERKQWPRLFRALKQAQDLSPNKKIKLIAHTKLFNNFDLGGWALLEESEKAGLSKESVIWTQLSEGESHAWPFDSDLNSGMPSLVKLYNTCDAYIHPSSVEAAGIPIIEAARCGLPILTTEYSSGWEYGQICGALPLPVNDYTFHSSGTMQALVSIPKTAEIMAKLANNPAMCHQLSAAAIKGSNTLSWSDLASKCVESSYRAMQHYKDANK